MQRCNRTYQGTCSNKGRLLMHPLGAVRNAQGALVPLRHHHIRTSGILCARKKAPVTLQGKLGLLKR
jgi:hypothetical protein